jgi:hypothetical protein
MRKFIITGLFGGTVHLAYSTTGILQLIDISAASLSPKQGIYLFQNVPFELDDLQQFCHHVRLNVVEQEVELTFDMFYEAYGYKEGRKKAEAVWAKLSRAEQLKAYLYIEQLKRKKKLNGEAFPYPATYLHQARWND